MNVRETVRASVVRLRRAWRFVRDDVWDIEIGSLSSLRRLGVASLRVVLLVFKGFRDDECPLHASALTFSALMAVVPILALSLSLARGLGAADAAKDRIREAIYDWTASFEEVAPEVEPSDGTEPIPGAPAAPSEQQKLADRINQLVEDAFQKVDSVNLTALSGVGLVLLLWMVIQVLGRVEASFNRVWGVVSGRSLWRRFADYLSVLVVLPILIVAASSPQVADLVTRILNDSAGRHVDTLIGSGLLKNLASFAITILSFSFLLMFMPNTKVRPGPGLAGGLVTALLFLGWLRLCAALQVGAARYGALYGSFATVPILLAWVYVSWQIVLFGAEVAFAIQNCTTYVMEQGAHRASIRAKITVALSVVVAAARAMTTGRGSLESTGYAREKRVPVRLLNDVTAELVRAGILAPVSDERGRFALLKDPAGLRAGEIIDTMLQSGVKGGDLGLNLSEPSLESLVSEVLAGANDPLRQTTIKSLLGDASS